MKDFALLFLILIVILLGIFSIPVLISGIGYYMRNRKRRSLFRSVPADAEYIIPVNITLEKHRPDLLRSQHPYTGILYIHADKICLKGVREYYLESELRTVSLFWTKSQIEDGGLHRLNICDERGQKIYIDAESRSYTLRTSKEYPSSYEIFTYLCKQQSKFRGESIRE